LYFWLIGWKKKGIRWKKKGISWKSKPNRLPLAIGEGKNMGVGFNNTGM